jgi:bifunctional DNA-binding transcriptional regulator/antitoxin component of YhaV-PrlF toxin-antitoxin module
MLFLGEYRVNYTGQGRIVIPKKIREAIGKTNSITGILTYKRNEAV